MTAIHHPISLPAIRVPLERIFVLAALVLLVFAVVTTTFSDSSATPQLAPNPIGLHRVSPPSSEEVLGAMR